MNLQNVLTCCMKHYTSKQFKNVMKLHPVLKLTKKNPSKQVIYVAVSKVYHSVSICALLGCDLLSCSCKILVGFHLSYIHGVLAFGSCLFCLMSCLADCGARTQKKRTTQQPASHQPLTAVYCGTFFALLQFGI